MPIYVGNSTVNTSIAGSNVTVNVPQGYAEYNATRNSIMPTLRLDFVNSNVLDPRITFTRASSATYFNSAGALTTAANNIPRFDYNPSTLVCNGLLIEQASTNLIYPSIITSSWNSSATLTTNATVAPDNTTTGSVLTPNTTLGQWAAWNYYSTALGTTYTLSCYAKPNGYSRLWLLATDFSGNSFGATFNLSTGVFVSSTTGGVSTYISSTITYAGNGWYRCSITGIPNTSNALASALYVDNGSGNYFTGNGTSGIQIWGAQLEQVAFPTSYIVTTSASATRAVDQTSLTGTNFSSWYNATNWTTTVYAIPANIPNTSGSTELLFQFTLDASNRILARINTSSSVITSYWINNISQPQNAGGYNSSSLTANTLFNYGMTASNGSWNLALNGTIYNSSAGYLITPTSFSIGYSSSDFNGFNGWIQRVAYYPVVVSNNELISLTS